MLGLMLFAGASLVCALAQNQFMLVGARSLQGLGAAVLSPATLTILTMTFRTPAERSRALGIWSAMAAVGGASGALLGGILTDLLSWRWIFYINIPIAAAALVAARVVLVETKAEGERPSLDVPGAILVTGGLSALVYAVAGTSTHSWGSSATVVPLGIAAICIAAFAVIETKVVRAPLVPFGSVPLPGAHRLQPRHALRGRSHVLDVVLRLALPPRRPALLSAHHRSRLSPPDRGDRHRRPDQLAARPPVRAPPPTSRRGPHERVGIGVAVVCRAHRLVLGIGVRWRRPGHLRHGPRHHPTRFRGDGRRGAEPGRPGVGRAQHEPPGRRVGGPGRARPPSPPTAPSRCSPPAPTGRGTPRSTKPWRSRPGSPGVSPWPP